MHLLPLLAALALGAAEPAPRPLADDSALPEQVAPRLKLLGLQVDAGLPDGGVVSLVVRPMKWFRADAGYAYNYFGSGARGGLTLVPFQWPVAPTLRVEAGRFFRSNVNSKVERFAGDVPAYMRPALNGFGYDYGSALLGLELGSQRSFVFFVRGGLTWVKASFGDGTGLQDASSPNTQVDVSGLRAHASGPTADLGFLFYVW